MDSLTQFLRALSIFRDSFYQCLNRRADALFEITDAILTTSTAPSPVHLSLSAVHRRGWGSLYAALSKGNIDVEALRDLLAQHPLAGDEFGTIPKVYAVDQWTCAGSVDCLRLRTVRGKESSATNKPGLPTGVSSRSYPAGESLR